MKKNSFKLLSLAVACALSLGVASCSEKDDFERLPDPPKDNQTAQYQAYFKGSAIKYFANLTAYVKNPLTGVMERFTYNKTDTCFDFKKVYDSIPSSYTTDSLEMYTMFFLDSVPSVETDMQYGYGAAVYNPNSSFVVTYIESTLEGIYPDTSFVGLLGVVADEISLNHDSIPEGGFIMVAH